MGQIPDKTLSRVGTLETTTVNITNTTINDKLMELASGTSGTPSGDAGLVIERGSSDNAAIIWDESRDEFVLGTTTATGASSGDLTVTPGNVSVERIGCGTEQAEAEVHAKRDTASGPQYSTTASIIVEDDARPSLQFCGSANNIALIQFADNAAAASGQLYYDHSADKLRIDAGGNSDRLTLDGSGNLSVTGDITLDDGGSLKEAGGTAAITFDASGEVTKLGQDTPSSGQFLKWDGSKVVWAATPSGGAADSVAADDISAGDAAITLATTTGNITIDAQGNDTDIIFKGTDGSSDTTFLTLDGSAAGAATFNDKVIATELDISGDADIDGTLEADAITVDGVALATYIRDTVGTNMLSSNTESGITVTYDTSNDNIDFAVDAAQTGITSILATDLKIGEDDQTKIDFETADEIHFYAANVEQVYLADNIFGPQSDSDVDLGTTGVRWKDAYVDSLTVTGAVTSGGTITNTAANDAAASLLLQADNSDDAGDDWALSANTNQTFTIANDIASAGTYVPMLVITPHATPTSSTTSVAGILSVAGTSSFTGDAGFNSGTVNIKGANDADAQLWLQADNSDDAGDDWNLKANTDQTFTIGNDIASAGTSVAMLTITPHATAASSAVAVAGTLATGGAASFGGAVSPSGDDGAALGAADKNWSDLFLADGAVLNFGDDQDVTFTHTADTGVTLNSTMKLMFNDASQFIQGSSATVLSIGATDEIDLTATAIDINGTADVSGALSASGGISLGDGKTLNLDSTPGTDHTATGLSATMTAGEDLTIGELVYIKSDGKVWLADADAEATGRSIGVATASISADAAGVILLEGVVRDDSWNWTVGGEIFTGTTAGAMTQTAPSGSGDQVQVVGIALTADVVLFRPSLDVVQVA